MQIYLFTNIIFESFNYFAYVMLVDHLLNINKTRIHFIRFVFRLIYFIRNINFCCMFVIHVLGIVYFSL